MPTEDFYRLSLNLRKLRERAGLSVRDAASAANVREKGLEEVECGIPSKRLYAGELIALCDFYGVSIEWLCSEHDWETG